jgi:hypothetical protein
MFPHEKHAIIVMEGSASSEIMMWCPHMRFMEVPNRAKA